MLAVPIGAHLMNFPILSVTLFAPLVGVLLILVIPRENVKTIRWMGIAFALLTLILTAIVWIGVAQQGADEMRYSERYPWIGTFNTWYSLGVDGLSAPMLLLTALLTTLSMFYSMRTIETRVKEYYLLFLLLEIGLSGVFMALDLVLFYVFWEVGLVPMFLLIGVWGGKQREHAAIKLFLYTLTGSVVMLLAIIGVYLQTGTFDILEAAMGRPFAGDFTWACVAFWAFFIAFAIKMAAFPFHTWLADAHTEAPTGAGVMLAGILLKLGAYGLIRIALPLFPGPFRYFVVRTPIIPVLAVTSIVYGALVCMAQWNLKRLIAYSSVAQMGYVILGVCATAAGTGMLDDVNALNAAAAGLDGAAMQMFTHGIIIGGFCFLVGIIYERTRTGDLKTLGGLAIQIPHYYTLTMIMGFALLGLPGLGGFWGEFFVFRGTIRFIPIAAFVGVLGLVFTAAYILWKIVQCVFLGQLDETRWGQLQDMVWWEKLTTWPLALMTILLGLYPTPVLDMFNSALTALIKTLP
jgi:NADH-quinone oxidoreductase subunit M